MFIEGGGLWGLGSRRGYLDSGRLSEYWCLIVLCYCIGFVLAFPKDLFRTPYVLSPLPPPPPYYQYYYYHYDY